MSLQIYKTSIRSHNYGQKCVKVVDSAVAHDFTYVRDISHDPGCMCVNIANECLTWRESFPPNQASAACPPSKASDIMNPPRMYCTRTENLIYRV